MCRKKVNRAPEILENRRFSVKTNIIAGRHWTPVILYSVQCYELHWTGNDMILQLRVSSVRQTWRCYRRNFNSTFA